MSAFVHETAEIAPGVILGPGAVIGAHARIGAHTQLDPYAVVGPYTTLGENNHVFSFAVVGGPAQDRRTAADAPHTLVCGSDNIFREGVTISRGTEHGGGVTRIGDHNLFMAHSHVGHDARFGSQNTIANGVSIGGHVSVGDHATIGGHAAIHQFVRIGSLAFVAANAMVSRDIPPYCMAAGDRAKLLGLNITGLKRAGFTAEIRGALNEAFGLLLRAGKEPRAQRAEAELKHPLTQVVEMATFILASERGVAAASRRGTNTPDGPIH